jgi:hypothetical protein
VELVGRVYLCSMKKIIFVQNGKVVKIINDDTLPTSVCERLLFIIKTADEIGTNVKITELNQRFNITK